MDFRIVKASDDDFIEYRTFNTLEELIAFMKEVGHAIILDNNFFAHYEDSAPYEITIYDDYIE